MSTGRLEDMDFHGRTLTPTDEVIDLVAQKLFEHVERAFKDGRQLPTRARLAQIAQGDVERRYALLCVEWMEDSYPDDLRHLGYVVPTKPV